MEVSLSRALLLPLLRLLRTIPHLLLLLLLITKSKNQPRPDAPEPPCLDCSKPLIFIRRIVCHPVRSAKHFLIFSGGSNSILWGDPSGTIEG